MFSWVFSSIDTTSLRSISRVYSGELTMSKRMHRVPMIDLHRDLSPPVQADEDLNYQKARDKSFTFSLVARFWCPDTGKLESHCMSTCYTTINTQAPSSSNFDPRSSTNPPVRILLNMKWPLLTQEVLCNRSESHFEGRPPQPPRCRSMS
jgi:hypothetical protein